VLRPHRHHPLYFELRAHPSPALPRSKCPRGARMYGPRGQLSMISTVARFAYLHPLIVAALFLAIAIGLIGLAVFGAVTLWEIARAN
jgi:hypothetical protein